MKQLHADYEMCIGDIDVVKKEIDSLMLAKPQQREAILDIDCKLRQKLKQRDRDCRLKQKQRLKDKD